MKVAGMTPQLRDFINGIFNPTNTFIPRLEVQDMSTYVGGVPKIGDPNIAP